MKSARRADLEVLFEFDGVNHRATIGALGPKALWHIVALLLVAEKRFAENTHGKIGLESWWKRTSEILARGNGSDNPDFEVGRNSWRA
jgi:hypothetical protein